MNLFGAVGEELWQIEPPANVASALANTAPASAHAAAPSNTATSNAAPSNDVMDDGCWAVECFVCSVKRSGNRVVERGARAGFYVTPVPANATPASANSARPSNTVLRC